MATPESNDITILRKAWIKAYRIGRLEIPLSDKKEAMRMRFAFYNAVKDVREGKTVNEELLEAASNCSITIDADGMLIVENKLASETFSMIADMVKDVDADVATPTKDDVDIDATLGRLEDKLKEWDGGEGADAAPKREGTPYFERGK